MQKIISKNYLLIAIIIFAAVVRLAGLSSNPPSPYWEEVALGYDAYSIYQTGRDHHGNSFPITAFVSFGDYKPSGYFYAIVPFLPFFDLSVLAVRLPSAIAGIFAVYLLFTIVKELGFSKQVALLSSLTLAIMPWSVMVSRVGFETNLATTFFLAQLLYIFRYRNKPQWVSLILSAIFMLLSVYTYHSYRLVAVLAEFFYLLPLLKTNYKQLISVGFVSLLCISPLLINLRSPEISKRFEETSIFSQSQAVELTNEYREEAGNTLVSRIVYHRYWWWGRDIVTAYLSHYDLGFLFVNGDVNPRHSVDGFGMLYHWQILFVLPGLYFLIFNIRYKEVLLWLALAPLAASLTLATPHALRSLALAPVLAFITAYGLFSIYNVVSVKNLKKLLICLTSIIIIGEGIYFYSLYQKSYPLTQSNEWQYGYREMVQKVSDVSENYNQIFISRSLGRPAMYYWFYTKADPSLVQKTSQMNTEKDQQELLEYENVSFFSKTPAKEANSLYVLSYLDDAEGFTKIDQIFDNNSEEVFGLYVYE